MSTFAQLSPRCVVVGDIEHLGPILGTTQGLRSVAACEGTRTAAGRVLLLRRVGGAPRDG